MTKVSSKISFKAIFFSLLFLLSSIGSSVLINPAGAVPNSTPAPLAATPLTALEANWAAADGNQFNQNFNPQTQINASNAQYLTLKWLFPLPSFPSSLTGALNFHDVIPGVDTAPLTINGTTYAVTQFDQAFAFNAANGNVLWTDLLPLTPTSLAGHGSTISLHLHDGNEQFTTKLFGNTPTWWISADDQKVYALNALTGAYELNFSDFTAVSSVPGNNPNAQYHAAGVTNLLVDQNRGIVITSDISSNYADSGRCFFRAWNILVNPPQMLWQTYCTPPQPGSNIPVDPNWDIKQVNNMTGAEIFYPGPSALAGGYITNDHGQAVVNLKTLSPSALNATLYNDWGYIQSPACSAITGGASTGSTAAGWGAPWLLGTGPTRGLAFINTNNKDPYGGPCNPGPDLWSAAVMALNETNGQWVWGFQATAHDMWDYDCSWQQVLGNETISGVNTQVLWKTCKNGYLYELNAQTGNLIWAWTPPPSIMYRCQYCQMHNPMNKTEMDEAFLNPSLADTLINPSASAGFENEFAYNPTLNMLFVASQNVPALEHYVPTNNTNYATNSGFAGIAIAATAKTLNNATVEAINAATGQMVWSYYIASQGYRGGLTTSAGVVYATLSSGDLLMLNAQSGALIKDLYIGGPLNELATIGATTSGQEEIIFPITAGLVTWGTTVPGDIVALTLQNVPAANTVTTTASAQTITTTVSAGQTTTVTSTVSSSGVSATTYGIAAVAVIFIIATGYLAMRGRKPAS